MEVNVDCEWMTGTNNEDDLKGAENQGLCNGEKGLHNLGDKGN